MGGMLEHWTQDHGRFQGGLAVVVAVVALLAGLVFWGTSGGEAAKRRRKGMPPVPPGSAGWPLLGETQAYLTAAYNNRISEFYDTRVAKYDLFVSLKPKDPKFLELEVAVEHYHHGIMQLPIDLPGTLYHKARLAREDMLRIIHPFIQQRQQDLKDSKASIHQDLLSVMLTTPYENGSFLTEEEIKDNLVLMLFAGHDTSSTALALVLKYLFLNPQCLEEVIQEQQAIAKEKAGAPLTWEDTRKMKYTWRVCQETMRLQAPGPIAFRRAIQDFEYEGYTIPKGWLLSWTVARSHYSPEFFPNPEKFDPSRFEGSGPPPYTFLAFGGGPHMCLGNEFARTEMLVYLHYLVLSFEWEMEDPEEIVRINPLSSFEKNLRLNIRKKENALAL